MKVLVACEESQVICSNFRKLNIEAYSCDILDCSGGHPEWHIKQDVLPLLDGNCEFKTCDGVNHKIDGKWDLLICHPICTYLTITGNRWFNIEKYGDKARERYKKRDEAAEFFMRFVNADCEHIAVENPVCIMSTRYRKPDQIINPFQFGHKQQKKTCLWLKNLPKLKETNNVYTEMMKLPEKERTAIWQMGSGHAKERSKTFPGIAKAMAEQWGAYLEGI